jgi:UDP-3-O-[3-hydroxymyristoyl] glucosamine N-acyltransferase
MEKQSNFISETAKIGKNVKVWHFSYIGNNSEIGDNVSIGSLVHIDYNVKIGDNTRIEGSVYSTANYNWKKCVHRSLCGIYK